MRISEISVLPWDCLLQDREGDWWLKYYQSKMRKEHSIAISKITAVIIIEQQQYIRENLGSNFPYLFCARKLKSPGQKFIPTSKPVRYSSQIISTYLNRLALAKNITDTSGQIWHFHPHQFRHTLGTRMINNGVPQPIIQRYLGHESPRMTEVYARIHDQTMKQEIAKFHSLIVDVKGKAIESVNPELDTSDLQGLRDQIEFSYGRTLYADEQAEKFKREVEALRAENADLKKQLEECRAF